MIVEYIRYSIPKSRIDEFQNAYRLAGQQLRSSDHCLGYELAKCSEDAGQYILRIEWDSAQGHLQGFRREPQFAEFYRHVQPFLEQIEEMRHYELTDVRFSAEGESEPYAG